MIIDHVDSSFHATHIFVTPVYNTNSRLQVEAGPFCGVQLAARRATL